MNAEQASKNTKVLQKAMGIKGSVKPGDFKQGASDIMGKPKSIATKKVAQVVKKLPPTTTKVGLGVRGLI